MNMQTMFQEYRKRKPLSMIKGLLVLSLMITAFYLSTRPVAILVKHKMNDIVIAYDAEFSNMNKSFDDIEINKINKEFKERTKNNLSFDELTIMNQKLSEQASVNKQYQNIIKEKESLQKKYIIKLLVLLVPLLLTYFLLFSIILCITIQVCEKYFKTKGYIKNKIENQKYNGSLYDIFDKDCEATNIILKEKSIDLENELLLKQSISGETLLEIEKLISIMKAVQEKSKVLEERKEILSHSNTQSGIMLRELNDLK